MVWGQHQLWGELKSFPPVFQEQLSPVPWCNSKSLQGRELTCPTKHEKPGNHRLKSALFLGGHVISHEGSHWTCYLFVAQKGLCWIIWFFSIPTGWRFTPPNGLKKMASKNFQTEGFEKRIGNSLRPLLLPHDFMKISNDRVLKGWIEPPWPNTCFFSDEFFGVKKPAECMIHMTSLQLEKGGLGFPHSQNTWQRLVKGPCKTNTWGLCNVLFNSCN